MGAVSHLVPGERFHGHDEDLRSHQRAQRKDSVANSSRGPIAESAQIVPGNSICGFRANLSESRRRGRSRTELQHRRMALPLNG
jgi:hypothetical protein